MWFRQLLIYRFTREIDLSADRLEDALQQRRARPCGSQEVATFGFIPPIGKSAEAPLVHASSGFLLIAARREERLLPGTVVRDALQEKIEEIETAQARRVHKKEREQLRDEVIQTLLPRAFVRRTPIYAAFAPALGMLLVNTSSRPRGEELLSALRETLDSLPVTPLDVATAPAFTFTEWLKSGQAPQGLTLLDACELRDPAEDGGVIRCKRQDLGSDEIRQHLDAGKRATQLSLAWSDLLTFSVDEQLVLRQLRFGDVLQERVVNESGDDAESQQDATFTLMMLTLADFLPRLINALEGEEPSPDAAQASARK